MKKIVLSLIAFIFVTEKIAAETPLTLSLPGTFIKTYQREDGPYTGLATHIIVCGAPWVLMCYTVEIPTPPSGIINNNDLNTGDYNPPLPITVKKASGEIIFQAVLNNYNKYQAIEMDNSTIGINHEFQISTSN